MARNRRGRKISGIIILDKPKGETSNRSLQKVKRLFDASKAGHTGSLDPLATGVLPLCFGEATKISQFLLDSDKAYRTTVRLGIKTDSGDSEGAALSTVDPSNITLEMLEKALESFRGEIEQTPSMFSALKHQGVPLYKLARQGKTVERKVRHVTIYDLKLLSFTPGSDAELELNVHCSKGTYIRMIADDLGDLLGVGGHLTALRRTKAGPFNLKDSHSFAELEALLKNEELVGNGGESGFTAIDALLVPADHAIEDIPRVILSAEAAASIKLGQAVSVQDLPAEGLVRLYNGDVFIGIGVVQDDGRLAPRRLFV